MRAQTEQYYQPKEVAHILNVTPFTIWRWIEKDLHDFPYVKINSRNFRIPKKAFEKWMNKRSKGV